MAVTTTGTVFFSTFSTTTGTAGRGGAAASCFRHPEINRLTAKTSRDTDSEDLPQLRDSTATPRLLFMITIYKRRPGAAGPFITVFGMRRIASALHRDRGHKIILFVAAELQLRGETIVYNRVR